MSAPLLLVFLRPPERGRVKTRLAKAIGENEALSVYQRLVQHTIRVAEHVPWAKQFWFADHLPMDGSLAITAAMRIQQGNDLGQRMSHAFEEAFAHGFAPVVIIGTDCPGLSEKILTNAAQRLLDHEVVIGPATDGGYYLLGMRTPFPGLFDNMAWSTSTVLQDTLEKCRSAHRSHALLPILGDVDVAEDLHLMGTLP